MSECLYGDTDCPIVDLREETCTNVSIRLSILMKKMKKGELQKFLITRPQYLQVEGIPKRYNLFMDKEQAGEDYIITISQSNI